jgi:hypothetical protein
VQELVQLLELAKLHFPVPAPMAESLRAPALISECPRLVRKPPTQALLVLAEGQVQLAQVRVREKALVADPGQVPAQALGLVPVLDSARAVAQVRALIQVLVQALALARVLVSDLAWAVVAQELVWILSVVALVLVLALVQVLEAALAVVRVEQGGEVSVGESAQMSVRAGGERSA